MIVTVVMGVGAMAQAQTVGARHDAGTAARLSDRINPATKWGRGLELSESGLARSKTPARDETYLVIGDAFGSSAAGPEAGARDRMTVGSRGLWASGFGSSVGPDVGARREWNLVGAPGGLGPPLVDEVGYYTPRFEGFQLGVSYVLDIDRDRSGSSSLADTVRHDGIAIGANFDRRFERLGIGVAAGYLAGNALDDAASPDKDAWSVAARLDLGGLSVSGAYEEINDSGDFAGAGTAMSSSDWNLGARYRWGLNRVTLTYSYSANESKIATPGNDERSAAVLGLARTLGPGIKWSVNLHWSDYSGENAGGADGNDGTALSTALRLSF